MGEVETIFYVGPAKRPCDLAAEGIEPAERLSVLVAEWVEPAEPPCDLAAEWILVTPPCSQIESKREEIQ
jgi:hypothetical protein